MALYGGSLPLPLQAQVRWEVMGRDRCRRARPRARAGQDSARARQDLNLRPLAPEAHFAERGKGGVCKDRGYIWASLKRADMARFGRDWAGFRHWCLNSRRSLVRTRSRCAGDAASATGGTSAPGGADVRLPRRLNSTPAANAAGLGSRAGRRSPGRRCSRSLGDVGPGRVARSHRWPRWCGWRLRGPRWLHECGGVARGRAASWRATIRR